MRNVFVQVAFLDSSSDVVNPARRWEATAVLTRMHNSSPERHFLMNNHSSENEDNITSLFQLS